MFTYSCSKKIRVFQHDGQQQLFRGYLVPEGPDPSWVSSRLPDICHEQKDGSMGMLEPMVPKYDGS